MIAAVETLETTEYPAEHAGARRVVRYLACLVPQEVPSSRLADLVCQVANHPQLPLEAVREILRGEGEGEGREVSGTLLRAVADSLREGRSLADTAELTGVSLDVVKNVSAWLGVVEARSESLQDAADEWIATGRSAREFSQAHGVGYTYARELLQSARAVEDVEFL